MYAIDVDNKFADALAMSLQTNPHIETLPLAFLSAIINSSSAGIMAFKAIRNSNNVITDFEWILINPSAENIINQKGPELVGKRLVKQMPGNEKEGLFDEYVKVVEKGDNFRKQLHYQHEGLNNWLDISAVKFNDGFIATFIDISSYKQIENELQQTSAKLEIHVRERNNELNEAIAKKDEFIGIASHELKTPLTSIKAYIQLLKRSIRDRDTQHIETFVNKAEINIEKLQQLISDLLDVSKIQAGKLNYNFEMFDFDQMLNDSIENVQYTSPKHKIIKQQTVKLQYYGDKLRLEQAMNNFLSNAVKYSQNADKVYVDAEILQHNIVVSVQDFGIGIPQESLKSIFDRFYRVDNSASKFSGLGLGLYIASEILKRHKGNFWIESKVEKGSTVYFLLPLTYS